MQIRRSVTISLITLLSATFVQKPHAQTINGNQTGTHNGYNWEYWKDNGTGTMTLKDEGGFSCSWKDVDNILFRKGKKPGSKNQSITYTADFKPEGNAYLSAYGWFQNPLVEYYIIESWGNYKPPGSTSKGTVGTDGGTYDLYQNERTGQSIEGPNKTFQQYWSVRKVKRTSGTITCINHFNAWESKGMKLGTLAEVAFNVEAYKSPSGSADVTMTMGTATGLSRDSEQHLVRPTSVLKKTGCQPVMVKSGKAANITFTLAEARTVSLDVYNNLGQTIAKIDGRKYPAGQHSVSFEAGRLSSGVYYYSLR